MNVGITISSVSIADARKTLRFLQKFSNVELFLIIRNFNNDNLLKHQCEKLASQYEIIKKRVIHVESSVINNVLIKNDIDTVFGLNLTVPNYIDYDLKDLETVFQKAYDKETILDFLYENLVQPNSVVFTNQQISYFLKDLLYDYGEALTDSYNQ